MRAAKCEFQTRGQTPSRPQPTRKSRNPLQVFLRTLEIMHAQQCIATACQRRHIVFVMRQNDVQVLHCDPALTLEGVHGGQRAPAIRVCGIDRY
jgi:hypothetical protein